MFWIAASNFVFPVMFNVAQLVIFMTTTDFTVCLYVQQANYFISIIGVVFATIWATGNNWAHDNVYDSEQGRSLSTLAAGPNPDHPCGPPAPMGSHGRNCLPPSFLESSSNVAASFAEAQSLDGKTLDARMQIVIPFSELGQVKDQI
ncbi:hypothetical protein A0H81_12150 [Grifola frondosa]|uniref:Transmembrane protein n=1 Tax=Grifola frondosa TaxID=5627 RepID=A0A1C7LTT8_GRIFR|nr:hypothetical protein A0H81_12150 [Grifola frondosa]